MKPTKLLYSKPRFRLAFPDCAKKGIFAVVVILSTLLLPSVTNAGKTEGPATLDFSPKPASRITTKGEPKTVDITKTHFQGISRNNRQLLLRSVAWIRNEFRSAACLPKYFCMLETQKPSKSTSSFNDVLYMLKFALLDTEDSKEDNYRIISKNTQSRSKRNKQDYINAKDEQAISRKGRWSPGESTKLRKKPGNGWKNMDFWNQFSFAAKRGREIATNSVDKQDLKCSEKFKLCRLTFDEMDKMIEGEPWINSTKNMLIENAAELSDWLEGGEDNQDEALKSRRIRHQGQWTPRMKEGELHRRSNENLGFVHNPKTHSSRTTWKFKGRHAPREPESSEEDESEHTTPRIHAPSVPSPLPRPRPTPVLFGHKLNIIPKTFSRLFSRITPPRNFGIWSHSSDEHFGYERPVWPKQAPRMPQKNVKPQKQIWASNSNEEHFSSEEESESSEGSDEAETGVDKEHDETKQPPESDEKNLAITTTQTPSITTSTTTETTSTVKTTTGPFHNALKKAVGDQLVSEHLDVPNTTPKPAHNDLPTYWLALLQQLAEGQNQATTTPLPDLFRLQDFNLYPAFQNQGGYNYPENANSYGQAYQGGAQLSFQQPGFPAFGPVWQDYPVG